MNGLGRYEEALAAASQAVECEPQLFIAAWALGELVEAATRTGDAEGARQALARLEEQTEASDADWALGVSAQARALVAEGDAAERSYQEAIDRLRRTGLRPEPCSRPSPLRGVAPPGGSPRRRPGRAASGARDLRVDRHGGVRGACARRAARHRGASAATLPDARNVLTPQEQQIARLARDGLSNSEIGAQLFLSPRTVEWHLGKVFGKLGVKSRRELRTAMSSESTAVALSVI